MKKRISLDHPRKDFTEVPFITFHQLREVAYL